MKALDKKELIREYKTTHRPMGVFQIRNTTNDLAFVDSSTDVPGKMNRHRFQLNAGVHPAKRLQNAWNELGEQAFEFEMLEPYEPRENNAASPADDIQVLETLWLERLEPYAENGYNDRKLTRGERLQMIAQNRNIPDQG